LVCLDTDFLIDLARKDNHAMQKAKELASQGEILHTTIVNAAEYYTGAFRSTAKDAIGNARQYIQNFSILLLEEESALLWAKLCTELRSNTIGERDLFIASIALSNGEVLLTRNAKHFERVPDLKVESW
jgi:tRNA(fMet)-specific endonuclease VapC